MKLFVDGSTSTTPGPFPILEYDLVTVAGQVNTVNRPIFLVALKTSNQLCVTDTTGGGTLTIPDAPGFSLTFGPGQVTFPGGSKTGCVSVTQVHPDKVPMEPAFGQQPRFIVTIQPAGAVFNPPAPITIPNVDGLKPREVTEMYSYDHDISSFVAIGTGTVSDDGQVIRSSPGVGVLKAGWHCGGNPSAIGTAADCPPCEYCVGVVPANSPPGTIPGTCVGDPKQAGKACSSPFNNCYSGGTCSGLNGTQPGFCQAGTPLTGPGLCNSGGSQPADCDNGVCKGRSNQCSASANCPTTSNPCIDDCANGACRFTSNGLCQAPCNGLSPGHSCSVGGLNGTCDALGNCNLCGQLGQGAQCTCAGNSLGTCSSSGQCSGCPNAFVSVISQPNHAIANTGTFQIVVQGGPAPGSFTQVSWNTSVLSLVQSSPIPNNFGIMLTLTFQAIAPGTGSIHFEYTDSNNDTATLDLNPTVVTPIISIADSSGNQLSGTQTVIVGQRIDLSSQILPAGLNVTAVSWNVDGSTVKAYAQTLNSGSFATLQPTDLTAPSISYYWIAGGTGLNVGLTVVIDGATFSPQAPTSQVPFDVERPSGGITLGDAEPVSVGSTLLFNRDEVLYRHINWQAQVAAPPNGGGDIAFVQRISTNISKTDSTGATSVVSSGGLFILDDTSNLPNQTNGINLGGLYPIGSSASATASFDDWPASDLSACGCVSITRRDDYQLYLVYKPTGANSIWVTLQIAKSGWSGTAVFASGEWKKGPSTYYNDQSGTDSTILPIWNGYFTGLP